MKNREDKKTVLIINTVGMGYDGMSHVILNYLCHMSVDGLDLHFTAAPDVNDSIRNTLENYGTIHYIPLKKENLWGYVFGLNKTLKSRIDVIHIHGNSGTMVIESLLARLHGVPQILVHCHNTKTSYPLLNRILTPIMKCMATDLIACSRASGEWLYGKSNYLVLNNAIDLKKYEFNPLVREEVRREFQVGDTLLVGHIGAFLESKNQPYLVEAFADFHRRYPNSKLMLVSDGPMFEAVKHQVEQLGLTGSVIFPGRRSDAQRLYQAMDVFVMPSRWEGLPLVMLEAQASGLPVLASDRITRDAACTDRVRFLSIDETPSVWADALMELVDEKKDRVEGIAQQLRQHGFDITEEAEILRDIYLA